MTRAEVLERIRKLHALARSTHSLPEAESASRKAASIAQRYRIDVAEIEAREGGDASAPAYDDDPLVCAGTIAPWRRSLAHRLAGMFGCVMLVSNRKPVGAERRRPDRALNLFGAPSDVAVVRELYAFASLQISALAARTYAGICTRRTAGSYCLGCVHGLTLQMTLAQRAARVAAAASTTALAIVDGRLARAEEALSRALPDLGTERRPRKVKTGSLAYQLGYEAGRKIQVPEPRAPKLETT